MDHPFITKLGQGAHLKTDDRRALEALIGGPTRHYQAGDDIVYEGDVPRYVRLIISGWACRYKHLPDGRRAIVSLYVPGDVCDHDVHTLGQMDHTIGALSDLVLVEIDPVKFETLTYSNSPPARALRWARSVEVAIQREWTFSLGRRNAEECLAHLFCELYYRLRIVGLVYVDGYDMPMTQGELADATGLTAVHVNRTMRDLRKAGLIALQRRRLMIPDLAMLEETASFDPAYLHLNGVDARAR